MRDISAKIPTLRTATAKTSLTLCPSTVLLIQSNKIPKGNPLEIAKVAAIQAAKSTSQLIPYCHPVRIDMVDVQFQLNTDSIDVMVKVKAIDKTGVEMEALTAASVAALTLYDMMKMLDESMEIQAVRLVEKTGGKSDFQQPFEVPLHGAVLVISDSVSAGTKHDRSGQLIVERLEREGVELDDYKIVSDEPAEIKKAILHYCDKLQLDLVITTGGTGISPRDNTPEAMDGILERLMPGIVEATRAFGQERTPYSMLSRGKAGVRGKTLVINLPGSTGGVIDSLDSIFPAVLHSFKMLRGGTHPIKTEQKEVLCHDTL